MFGKKDPQVVKPTNDAPAPAPAADAKPAKPAPKAKAPKTPGAKPTFGDICVMGSAALLAVTVVLQLITLKTLFLF